MSVIQIRIPHFYHPVDLFCPEPEYEGTINLRGEEVGLLLDLDEVSWVGADKINAVKKMSGKLVSMDEINRRHLLREYSSPEGKVVRYYLEYHLQNVWRPTLEKRINFYNSDIEPIDQLFNRLHLDMVSFTPDEKDDVFVKFYYGVDPWLCEFAIILTFNQRGELQDILMDK